MPTYQYTCTDCAEPVEVVQKFTDEPLSVCVACGGRLRKVFSPVGIVFKGSGFYRTDSRNGASSGTAAKDKQPSEATATANGADKPADKTTTKASDKVSASSGSSSSSSSEKVA